MQLRAISVLGLAVLVFAAPADATTCPRGILTGQVTHVRDGDTIVVGSMPIRLNGLGGPEGELETATTRTTVNAVAKRLIRAKAELQRLQVEASA
jgi:endonuclease YncB( thermonuclease family)